MSVANAVQLDQERRYDEFVAAIAGHEQRRSRGEVTVSTVVGDATASVRMWKSWASDHHRSVVFVSNGPRAMWLESWIAGLLERCDLYVAAEQYLAARLWPSEPTSCRRLNDRTLCDIDHVLEQAQLADYGLEADRLCRWLLRRRAKGEALTVEALICQQLDWIESTSADTASAFGQLIGILPAAKSPALVVAIDGDVDQYHTACSEGASRLSRHGVDTQVAQLAAQVPGLTLSLVVESDVWETYLRMTPASFAKAVLQDHVLDLDAPPLADIVAPNSEAVEADFDDDDPWRSEAERFLFRLLEESPDLRGLFQLNADPGFKFGNQRAEIDLACLSLRIAIEVDGYYHFLDAERYRRDRRKDLVLQCHGYLVVRFLADDVVVGMVDVLSTIRSAVSSRRAELRESRC